MRLRDHPRINWPPLWSGGSESSVSAEEGTLKDIDLIERDELGPTRLLLAGEFQGKTRFAEITCGNEPFARKLYEKIKPLCGQPVSEVGNSDLDS